MKDSLFLSNEKLTQLFTERLLVIFLPLVGKRNSSMRYIYRTYTVSSNGIIECRIFISIKVDTIGPTNQLTCLIPDLTGVDPDDAFSTVPYEKGQTLLWYLESLVGGPSTRILSIFFYYTLSLMTCFIEF